MDPGRTLVTSVMFSDTVRAIISFVLFPPYQSRDQAEAAGSYEQRRKESLGIDCHQYYFRNFRDICAA